MDFQNRVAIITGGTGALGGAVVWTHFRQCYASAAGREVAAPRAIILSSVRMFNISWRRG